MPRSAGKPRSCRLVPSQGMRLRAYSVVQRAVEEGVGYGIGRLWKHYDGEAMPEDYMRERAEAIMDAVMGALCEVFDFGAESEL